MFYSHQLLARKASLGQIWMAATLHAKINRKKLNKLNIIKICEEILNPSVPMALRLSGILMGGVVIVYERKVKLLYDDVSRLLVEINEAWKVKTVADPTLLPKGKTQAKYEAVTLKDNEDTDVGDVEQSLHFSNATTFRSVFPVGLDHVGETYINIDPGEGDIGQQHHQADAANITLFDNFGSHLSETNAYNRFERFDIEGEEETLNFTPQEYPQVPTTLVPSPPKEQPPQDVPAADDEIHERQQKSQDEQPNVEDRNNVQEAEHNLQRQLPTKQKARRRPAHTVMDNELTIIPGHVYQSWLQNTSDISSRRRKKGWLKHNQFSMRISNLMELPPVALISGLDNVTGKLHYPALLMEQWAKCTLRQPSHDSPSLITTPLHPPEPSSSSPKGGHAQDHPEFPAEDFQSGIASQEQQISVEKLRADLENIEQIAVEEALKRNLSVTPGSLEHSARSIPSSASGHSLLQPIPEYQLHSDPEIQQPSGRSRKRQHSSSRQSLGSLDPVEEDIPWQQNGSNFKLRRLSENGPTLDSELLEETVPTQTPMPAKSPLMDEITRSIQTQLKVHFDTPGNPQVESLNQLAVGMTRRKAALLFYQTCVLASTDYLRVEQEVAYGDISISRGPKM